MNGMLHTKLNSTGNTSLILNGKIILTLQSNDVDETFIYSNLPYHKLNKNQLVKM